MSNTTPIASQISRNALNVHLGFAVLFFGIGSVQQFTTVWFNAISLPAVGKTALLLLYTTFFFASISSHRFVEILGVKRCFMLSTVVYSAFILTLCLANPVVIYVAAILCGLSASTLWTSFFLFLNSIEDTPQRKRESGRFWRYYYLGTCIGILALNILRSICGYRISFLVFGAVALSAIFFFNHMTETERSGPRADSGPIRRWGLVIALAFTTWSSRIIYGLVIASVPMDVALYADAAYVGWISAPLFLYTDRTFRCHFTLDARLGNAQHSRSRIRFFIVWLGLLWIRPINGRLWPGSSANRRWLVNDLPSRKRTTWHIGRCPGRQYRTLIQFLCTGQQCRHYVWLADCQLARQSRNLSREFMPVSHKLGVISFVFPPTNN